MEEWGVADDLVGVGEDGEGGDALVEVDGADGDGASVGADADVDGGGEAYIAPAAADGDGVEGGGDGGADGVGQARRVEVGDDEGVES